MADQVTKYNERFAEMAQSYTETERPGGDFLSTKGGILTFQEEELPGNQMCVVILDVVHERTFYTHKWDPNAEINYPPVCYAFGRTVAEIKEMGPHPSMQAGLHYFQPQNDECSSCPNNEWGTADTGRGKACAERRRMALLPAGYYEPKRGSRDFDLHLIEEVEHYNTADIALLKLPVTSVKDYGRYITQLNSQYRRPPFGVITRVYLEPNVKSQFRVKFETIDLIPEEWFDVILARHEEAKANIIFPYVAPSAEEVPARGRGVRR